MSRAAGAAPSRWVRAPGRMGQGGFPGLFIADAPAAPTFRQKAPLGSAQCDSAARKRPSRDHARSGESLPGPILMQKRGHDEGSATPGARNDESATSD